MMDFDLEQGIAILSRTPQLLRFWLTDLPEPWITHNDGKDSWSAYEILGHFIFGEQTDWIPRAEIILKGNGHDVFEPFDFEGQFDATRSKSLDELLDLFAELRKQNLQRLRDFDLQPSHYDMTAVHPALGPVTLRQLLATWVAHDLNHLGHLAEVMARQYREAVGPWKAYLDILGS